MDKSLDLHEQCSTRNCLLIHNVKDNVKENTDEVITDTLEKEKVSNNDIDPINLEKDIPEIYLGL